jgi:hypothetical protein
MEGLNLKKQIKKVLFLFLGIEKQHNLLLSFGIKENTTT